MGAIKKKTYEILEVFENRTIGFFTGNSTFKATVNPTGVFFGKAIPYEKPTF